MLSVDPDSNRFWLFTVELCTVDDGVEIRRRWGRVGTAGRTSGEIYPSMEVARGAWDKLLELDVARRLLAWHRLARRAPSQAAFPVALGF